jgi:uncharacterized protein YbbC (DUF1343 family)
VFVMRNICFWGVVLTAASAACGPDADGAAGSAGGDTREAEAPSVRVGAEVLLSDSLHLVRGRRVGLFTNHTGIVTRAVGEQAGAEPRAGSTIDALYASPEVDLVALFGPEHSIRGDVEAGDPVDSTVDPDTGLPIHSVYGATLRPTPEMLEGLDVLVFDMQDVGARYYTYPSTMAYAMEAAAEHDIPFVVLDRPNPIRGDVVQGNVLDPEFASFVGLYPVPMRHGMTMGELARMFVGEFGIDVELHVVPMEGWRRDMTFDLTGLPWVAPSPNMPSLESALAYPGTCLFEGTPLSVGRGTDRAFQWVGAPWLNGEELARQLNAYGFRGVRFEPATFTPENAGDDKFSGVEVHGVRLVPESTDYDASRVAVAMLVEARAASGDRWSWREGHVDRLAGTDAVRLAVESGAGLEEVTRSWAAQLESFERTRAPYLLYD